MLAIYPMHHANTSCTGNRSPQRRTSLSGIQPLLLHLHGLRTLLHDLLAFGEDEFDVARVRHVGINLQFSRSVFLSHASLLRVIVWMKYRERVRRNVRVRGHGMYDDAAWAPD